MADEISPNSGRLPKQGTVNSLHVLSRRNLIAATTKSTVFVYPLKDGDASNIGPSAVFDLEGQAFEHKNMTLLNARWMTDNLMALGLQGCKDPLRYLTITPSGFAVSAAAKNSAMEEKFAIDYGRLCANSLVPVTGSHGGHNLLLSAWRDGTVRLQDLRSPSPFDLVYCDNIDPWSEFETLLTYGTERFIGGGIHGATVKVFDFRWTKDYYHTSAMPCGGDKPFPLPHQPFATAPKEKQPTLACCDHLQGHRCRWHELSRDIFYRPNCSFFFSKSLPPEEKHAGVWSLAKASDISPNFYIGISGGVVEANLHMDGTDPNLGFNSHEGFPSKNVSYKTVDLSASLMEIGDGLASPQNDRNIRIPTMRGKGWGLREEPLLEIDLARRKRHRLDIKYQVADDFRQITVEESPWWRTDALEMPPPPINGRGVVRDI
ncbi:putative f-box domain protein [Phaeoacremonium minimum UCRPA7]|uniref:Putative f-box domain protein n=1 Tax=Phaeoacremonium minimum (strain UCR-PA7) TaxID=1286976 RepID=R8BWK9_PHAM7|nr:putative f-box domain protein [Phaeoacremonium minimum UCRPA7]EOO03689.1 putative f-box domain protein [Phaeoacremonium minimum UCRPA7]